MVSGGSCSFGAIAFCPPRCTVCLPRMSELLSPREQQPLSVFLISKTFGLSLFRGCLCLWLCGFRIALPNPALAILMHSLSILHHTWASSYIALRVRYWRPLRLRL